MISVFLALVFSGSGPGAQDPSSADVEGALRLKLQAGQQLSYRSVTNMSMSIARGEGAEPVVLSTKQQQSLGLAVASTSEKGYLVRTTVKDSKSAITQGQGAGASLAGADKATIGVTTESTFSDRGVAVGATRVVRNGKATGAASGNMGFFSTGFLGIIYPKGEVKPGSSWASSVDMGKVLGKALGGMKPAAKSGRLPIRFKLLKFEATDKGPLAHIGFSMSGQVEFAPTVINGTIESGPLAILRSNGKAVVQVSTGIPLRCDLAAKTEIRSSDGRSTQRVTVAMKRQ